MTARRLCTCFGIVWLALASLQVRESLGQQPAEIQIEVVAQGLEFPTGIAIDPEGKYIYVCESSAGRVVRLNLEDRREKPKLVVQGFAREPLALEASKKIGPLSIAFLDKDLILVGEGGNPAGKEVLRGFFIHDLTTPQTITDARLTLGPLATEESELGGEDFFGILVGNSGVWIACQGNNDQGWLSKVDFPLGEQNPMLRIIAASSATKSRIPCGLASNAQDELVVSFLGEISANRDSRLAFFDAHNSQLLWSIPVGVYDLVAIAYGSDGLLYGLDLAWQQPSEGGLFRLDAAPGGVTPVKLASISRPTAMQFNTTGDLFIAALDSPDGATTSTAGTIFKVTAETLAKSLQ